MDAASSLVPIQTKGSRPALFCVHPVDGAVHCFEALAKHLDAEQPVYALRAQGLEAGEQPFTTVAEMATAYLELVRSVQPRGPYHLVGYSFGSAVVVEMARLLQQDGDEVGLLAVLDL